MKIIFIFLAISLIALTIQAAPPDNSDDVGEKMFHQRRLVNIIKGRIEAAKAPVNMEQVGDFQFYQGPFINIIRALQNLIEWERDVTKEDESIELTPSTI